MNFDAGKVRANVRRASTEDLLDRVTVYREGMEEEALAIIEAELQERGLTSEAIQSHGRAQREACLWSTDGIALQCSFCRKPAVSEEWGWHCVWGLIPVFPRRFRYCCDHRPERANSAREDESET